MNNNKMQLRQDGSVEKLILGGYTIPFVASEYMGPALFIEMDDEAIVLPLWKHSDDVFEGQYEQLQYTIEYLLEEHFAIKISLKNTGQEAFSPDRLFLRTGIDTYMSGYPQWNAIMFPTLLRCEKTHFWGYLMNPLGEVLTVTCDTPIKSWKLSYNKVNEEHNGHRIHTFELDLLSQYPQPERHPNGYTKLEPFETESWIIKMGHCPKVDQVPKQCASLSSAPMLQAKRYTLEQSKPLEMVLYADKSVNLLTTSPSGVKGYHTFEGHSEGSACLVPLTNEHGLHTIVANDGMKMSEMKVYKRKNWSWYLEKARVAAIEKPQKASTHLEAWYGFFSIMLAAKHLPNKALDDRGITHFDRILSQMYDIEAAKPLTDPGRICNTSAAISMLVDTFEATNDLKYLKLASRLGDLLMTYQHPDGSYRAYYHEKRLHDIDTTKPYEGDHYTSVIYIAKSMLELARLEERIGVNISAYALAHERHHRSAHRAIDNLVMYMDNIDTEGELTFEDGMISCSALQIALFALLEKNPDKKRHYTDAAVQLINKHRCLEQMMVPDGRMNGATLRFWEAQYDILLDKNMMNSPHGWTSWKTYATYYLYLLTGEIGYLEQTMNTLGACMQMVDVQTGNLRWAFIVDPFVKTKVWVESSVQGRGEHKQQVIGEQYMDMISGWWKTIDDKPVGAYPCMPLVTDKEVVQCDNIGGCCDNDVHEHFKCLEEVALTKAYIADKDGDLLCWNCRAEWDLNKVIHLYPSEEIVTEFHFNLQGSTQVTLHKDDQLISMKVTAMGWVNVLDFKDKVQ